jgi:ribose transport system permease protein
MAQMGAPTVGSGSEQPLGDRHGLQRLRETTRVTLARPKGRGGQLFAKYALVLLGVALFAAFSAVLSQTFPTANTVDSILSDQSTVALLALAELLVISVGHYDLSVGYGVGVLQLLTIGLLFRDHIAWPAIIFIVLVLGAIVGLVNGLLVTVAKIDSFIATLGVGYVLFGVNEWYSGGEEVIGNGFPHAFGTLYFGTVLGIPAPAIYIFVLAVLMWLVLQYLPTGRYMYAIGSNQRAAELSGIRVRRYTIGAFVAAGVIVAVAGVLLAANLQVGESNIGSTFLLPAFVGALLGATAIKPGRVNVWGTIVAVLVLGIGIAGIEQLGGKFYTTPLFDGGTLIVSVGAAGFAARRQRARTKRQDDAALAEVQRSQTR